jgi:sugar phosphate isomerase/epimerase
MQFGVFTVMLPDLSPEDAVAALAATGYQGVEWRVAAIPEARRHEAPSFWGNNRCTLAPTPDDARRARRLAQATGLAQLSAATYLSPESTLQEAEAALEFAAEAGIPSLRINTARYQGDYAAAFARSRDFFCQLLPLARTHGVRLLIETHHQLITPSAALAHRFVSHFDPAHVGVIYDPGNMVFEGFESYQLGLELLGDYLSHIHLKNAAYRRTEAGWAPYWTRIDQGVADLRALLGALRATAYTGWLVFEDFSGALPSLEALAFNRHYLETLLDEVRRAPA